MDTVSSATVTAVPRFVFEPVSKLRHKAVPEIIKGYIPMGLKGLFFGDEKTFKTPVAVKIGVDVAMPGVGHHGDPSIPGIEYQVLRHGAVRYVAAELPQGVHTRAREYILSRDAAADPETVDFKVLDGKPDLTAPPDVDDLMEALDNSLDPRAIMRLIFIDTTVFCLGGADENHPSTVTHAYNAADAIIDRYDKNCSVIFIQHTGKDQSRGVRGSSNWEKSAGFRLEFAARGKVDDQEDGRAISYPKSAIVTSEKNKDGPFQQRLQYNVRRETFESFEIDNDNDLVQPVNDSVLHLSVVPYCKTAHAGEKSKSQNIKTAKRTALRNLILQLIDLAELDHSVNTWSLANIAESNGMLKGKPETRTSNFRKQIYRFMCDHSSEIDAGLFKVVKSKKGKDFYVFIGQGGQMGLSAKLATL